MQPFQVIRCYLNLCFVACEITKPPMINIVLPVQLKQPAKTWLQAKKTKPHWSTEENWQIQRWRRFHTQTCDRCCDKLGLIGWPNVVVQTPNIVFLSATQFVTAVTNIPCVFISLSQVDTSVFDSREMVQSLAFGLSFLQRMDMKPVVVMGRSEQEEMGTEEPVAGSRCTRGLVGRSQQLTEALQQHTATVLPLFSAESFLLLHEAPRGSRSGLRHSRAPSFSLTTALKDE